MSLFWSYMTAQFSNCLQCNGVFTLPDTETDTETDIETGCIELCGRVHTAHRQTPAQNLIWGRC